MSTRRFLTGLIGRDIQASRSPAIHEGEADVQGVRLIYSLFDFARANMTEADLPRLLAALQLAGFAGVNVTHPYKQAVIECLDELTDEASEVGAVNTVAFRDGKSVGHNTDAIGFAKSFEQDLKGVARNRVVQLGAGGAGAATAHALLSLGIGHLAIRDPDSGRLAGLIDALAERYGADRVSASTNVGESIACSDGLVNATPVGMDKHPGMPVSRTVLRPDLWVADIIYFPLETELLAAARQTGCRAINGSGMVVHQAVAAFEFFTGLTADVQRMQQSFLDDAATSDPVCASDAKTERSP
jgi:shikimate dehydrogenase